LSPQAKLKEKDFCLKDWRKKNHSQIGQRGRGEKIPWSREQFGNLKPIGPNGEVRTESPRQPHKNGKGAFKKAARRLKKKKKMAKKRFE